MRSHPLYIFLKLLWVRACHAASHHDLVFVRVRAQWKIMAFLKCLSYIDTRPRGGCRTVSWYPGWYQHFPNRISLHKKYPNQLSPYVLILFHLTWTSDPTEKYDWAVKSRNLSIMMAEYLQNDNSNGPRFLTFQNRRFWNINFPYNL